MQIVFLPQDKASFLFLPSGFGIIKVIICFSQFELIFEIQVGHISFSLTYKSLRAIVELFFHIFSNL